MTTKDYLVVCNKKPIVVLISLYVAANTQVRQNGESGEHATERCRKSHRVLGKPANRRIRGRNP
jgi:hypothetical protein